MLVLTRRLGEIVRLHTSDGVIEIRLNDCNDHQARLGFTAPQCVKILRAEIDNTEIIPMHAEIVSAEVCRQRKTVFCLLREFFTFGSTGLR